MAPRKKALPNPLPDGFLLTDTEKTTWRLGKIIGQGGFGLIYLASQNVDTRVAEDSEFVIKVEFHENGPLFSELKFYQRAAKPDAVWRWRKSRKLDFLGIPTYWGSGLAEHNGTRYRFMVMDRLGIDLQKVCNRNGGRLRKTTVLYLAQTMLNVLEYIHDNEYVHADIKAANLMLGHRDPEQVYLADYGLAYRFCPDGIHKDYKDNPKKGHNGTMEYTSLDAHKGAAPSRRGDLQVLGFCLLHWLCGSLPWDSYLKKPSQVQEAKARLMEDLPGSVTQLSVRGASTDEVASLLLYVKSLDYKERPDYQRLRELLASGGPGRLDLSGPGGEAAGGPSAGPLNPPARGKKAGQARGPSKAKPTVDSEEEDGGEEEDEEEERKPKPVAPRYIRGRPAATPQTEQPTGTAPRRSPRTRGAPVYVDWDEEEEEEEEEEEDDGDEGQRPRPIEARYIRGPPIGPRPQPEQGKTAAKYKRRPAKTLDVAFAKEIKHGRSHTPGEADGGEKGGPGRRRRADGLGLVSPYRREGHGQTVGVLGGQGSSNEGGPSDPGLRKSWRRTARRRPDPYQGSECEEPKVKGHESEQEGSGRVGRYVAAALCVMLSLLAVVAVAGGA